DVLFHEVNFTERDVAANCAAICKEAPAALARLGLTGLDVGTGAADVRAALDPCCHHLATPEFKDLAGGCYKVLLVWAEAEATPLPSEAAAERVARARKALRLLDVAADLAKAYELPSPRVYHLRKARYLVQAGDDEGARREQANADRVQPDSPLDR